MFGKAIVVVGEEIFEISSFIEEQTATKPYRLLPSVDGSNNPYRLKEVPLRLEGVQPESKNSIQVSNFTSL